MSQETISVTLTYFAMFREQRGLEEETLFTTAVCVGDLYDELAAKHRFTLARPFVALAVNAAVCPAQQPLKNGDQVTFIQPVAGG